MKVLCLGNNTVDTENKTKELSNNQYNGLLFSVEQDVVDGYYQTSVFDLSRADILEASVKFDKIVVLDQGKDQYSHPESFYTTVSIGKMLAETMPVEFLDSSNASDVDFFTNLVETNPSFCIFPFISLSTNDQRTMLCCRAARPFTKLDGLDFYNDTSYKEVRQKMLAGQKLPTHCSACYKEESLGIRSHRQQGTVTWASILNLKTLNDLAQIRTPAYYEIKPSNLCNLQCRMCGPSRSSRIEQEYKEIGLIPKDYTVAKCSDFDFVDFSNLRKFYIHGGEPSLLLEFSKFLDHCVSTNNTEFELIINTNAAKFTEKFKEQINNFSNAGFVISVDGIGDVGKYIRWPAEWDDVVNNIQWITNANHSLTFNTTVSIYNIVHLFDTLQFLETNYPASLISCGLAISNNDILSATNFPDSELATKSLTRIKNLKCYKNSETLATFVDKLLDHFRDSQYNRDKLTQFFEFNDKLDQSRGVKLKDYLPELDKYRHEI